MVQDRKSNGRSSKSRDDVPLPEKGSPQIDPDEVNHGEAEDRVEKGEEKDPNPLAPPVNTQGGS